MALIAKMQARKVEQYGNGRWVVCEKSHPAAEPVEKVASSMYGIPPWLVETGFVRWQKEGQSQEQVELVAVSAVGEDDPNREWASASPMGELKLTIQNPGAFDYIEAGAEYTVTVRKVQPQKARPGVTVPRDGSLLGAHLAES